VTANAHTKSIGQVGDVVQIDLPHEPALYFAKFMPPEALAALPWDQPVPLATHMPLALRNSPGCHRGRA